MLEKDSWAVWPTLFPVWLVSAEKNVCLIVTFLERVQNGGAVWDGRVKSRGKRVFRKVVRWMVECDVMCGYIAMRRIATRYQTHFLTFLLF